MGQYILACVVLCAAYSMTAAQQVCSIKRESLVTPFGAKESNAYRLAMPCRYQLVDFRVNKPPSGKGCRPRMFAAGVRVNGSYYVTSFDVRLSIYHIGNPKKIVDYIAIKVFGEIDEDAQTVNTRTTVRNTVYGRGKKWAKESTDLSAIDKIFPGTKYGFTNTDGEVLIHVEACDLHIEFKHIKLDMSNYDSAGLVVKIPDHHIVEEYFQTTESACIESCISGQTLAFLIGAHNPTDAMTFNVARHWRRNPGHNYANMTDCIEMQKIVQTCPAEERVNALKACMFILTNPDYLNCASNDRDSSDVITSITECFNYFCSGSTKEEACTKRTLAASCKPPATDICSQEEGKEKSVST